MIGRRKGNSGNININTSDDGYVSNSKKSLYNNYFKYFMLIALLICSYLLYEAYFTEKGIS